MSAGTDYDARIRPPAGLFEADESIDELRARRAEARSATDDDDIEVFDLTNDDPPVVDLPDDELTVPVVPMSSYEFRCSRCFLVHHRSQRVIVNGEAVCRDCA